MKDLDSILPMSDEGLYPIRTVSEVTGVNSITLRAWERRHNLFKPKRSPKGHRLYSDKDIQRIQQVLTLLSKGVSISRVSQALSDSLTETRTTHLSSIQKDDNNAKGLSKKQWELCQAELLLKINSYSNIDLENFHHFILSRHPVDTVSENLIIPTLDILKDRAEQLKSLSGEYHFYRSFILNRMGGLFLKLSIQNSGKKLFLIASTNNHSYVKSLLFAMPFIEHGYQLIIMGCDIPLEAIPASLSDSEADALLLYSDTEVSKVWAFKSLEAIAKSLHTPVFIAGPGTKDEESTLRKAGLIVLPKKRKNQIKAIDKKLNKNTK